MPDSQQCQRCESLISVPADGSSVPTVCPYCDAPLDLSAVQNLAASDTTHAQGNRTQRTELPPKPDSPDSVELPRGDRTWYWATPVSEPHASSSILPEPVPTVVPTGNKSALTQFPPPPEDPPVEDSTGEVFTDELNIESVELSSVRVPPTSESSKGPIQQIGQYRILQLLGRGGFGAVYLARDSMLKRRVAIKVCDVASQGRDAAFQRFLREARLGASLDHPALCHIIDVQREDGMFYIVMEYVEGENLNWLVERSSQGLPPREASRIGVHLIEVLKYLSGKGIVHRDIKPSNIIVRPDQTIKLLDLGLGKNLHSPDDDLITQEGTLLGTPAVMAPEQIQGDTNVTPANDLYAAGSTLYFLLTKEFPFRGSFVEVIGKVIRDLPDDPRTHRPDLPDDLAQLVLQMLAKRPRDRPDHDQVLAVLKRYAGGETNFQSPAYVEMPTPLSQPSPRDSLFDFLDHAAHPTQGFEVGEDELMRLLPRKSGHVFLGEYLLKRPIGRMGQFATYEGEMPFGGVACFIRTLPPSISALDPERLKRLLNEHGRLMQISARSAHLSGITFLGRAELKRRLYPTVYYTVEPWIRGSSLQNLIDQSEDLSHKDACRYLAQAMAGLSALHEHQYLHGNLHPAKLLLDDMARELLVTDLTQIRRISRSQLSSDEEPFFPVVNPGETIATQGNIEYFRGLERRQYEAPELFVANERPSPNTEQYALGVIFIEALTSHMGYVKSARENLDHFTKAREDLEDRLDEISSESPALAQVLWKMVKLNPRSRFANLREAHSAILRSGRLTKATPSLAGRPADAKRRSQKASPPARKSRGVYDVFISYRRDGGGAVARAIVERLERLGQRVFLDVQTLQSGRFDTRLLRYIKNSRNFLLVLTPGALDRCRDSIDDWLRIEISHAIKCRTNIVPVMLPEFQMPPDDQLPHALKSLKKINGVHYDHLQFDGMIEKLQKDFLK